MMSPGRGLQRMVSHGRSASEVVSRSLTFRLNRLTEVSKGGEGSKLMLTEREKPGYFCFRNSYWQISLFSIKGRAVPWLPLLIYLIYTTAVCVGVTKIPGYKQLDELKQLSSVTTTIGVALFLLLSFRNNAAFTRWQNGSDKFKNFCALAKNTARAITGNLSSYIAVGGKDVAYDLVQERLKWLMVALEVGRQSLRGEHNEEHLLDLLEPQEIEMLLEEKDPVLFCMYKVLDMDRMYFVQKANEWLRNCDFMYMEFTACMNVFTTPIPFAYISHMRTFLVLWMGCIPWVYVIYYGYYTILVCAIIGYGIIGVEEAAVEVENPFGTDFNDIPLDSIVADTYAAIGTYVRIVRDAKRAEALQTALANGDDDAGTGGKDADKGAAGGGKADKADKAGGGKDADRGAPRSSDAGPQSSDGKGSVVLEMVSGIEGKDGERKLKKKVTIKGPQKGGADGPDASAPDLDDMC